MYVRSAIVSGMTRATVDNILISKFSLSMARSTKEEAQETRNRILDAAEDVFHANGVGRTTLADVADAAGVTRGAIYWHFKNKSDLFDAMCERVRLPMEAMVEANADEAEIDPLGQLRQACIFVFNEATSNPHSRKVFDILFHKCEFVDDADPILIRQRECYQEGSQNVDRVLRNAIARGQLPADLDVSLAGVMLRSTMHGLLNDWLFAPGTFDLHRHAERFVDACIDTLRHALSLRTPAT
jgi:TetR/AcrR family acrAB operon transcriptional repressor